MRSAAAREVFFGGLIVVLSTAAVLGFGELTIRAVKPKPRIQIVRRKKVHYSLIDGVPVWSLPGAAERADDECRARLGPRARTVAFFGDSIFFGTELPPKPSAPPPAA